MPERSITFFVPGLFEPGKFFSQLPANDVPHLPSLEYFLNRATVVQSDIVEQDVELAALFGFPELPVAALIHNLSNPNSVESDLNWYLCADPVYIQADRDDAVLVAHEKLELNLDEANTIASEINKFYKDEPWELIVLSENNWVIKCSHQYDLKLTSLKTVFGQHVRKYLPQGKDAKYWHQIFNEIQMLLHGMSLNQKRELEGMLPVNSLWFWGAGSLPEYDANSIKKWQIAFGHNRAVEALTKFTNTQYYDLSDSSNRKADLNSFQIEGGMLYQDQIFSPVATQQDFDEQTGGLLEFDYRWMKQALTLLKTGRLESMYLMTGNGKNFYLKKSNVKRKRWAWWKAKKLFQQFVE